MTGTRSNRAAGKIRVEGPPGDVETFVAHLRRTLVVTYESEFCPNKSTKDGRGRVYLDVLEPLAAPSKPLRGVCCGCGNDYMLTAQGLVRRHEVFVSALKRMALCDGARQLPQKVIE